MSAGILESNIVIILRVQCFRDLQVSWSQNMIVMRACPFFQGTSRLPEGLERLQRLEHWSRTGWRQDFTGSILSQRGPNRLHGSSGVVPDGNNTLRNC